MKGAPISGQQLADSSNQRTKALEPFQHFICKNAPISGQSVGFTKKIGIFDKRDIHENIFVKRDCIFLQSIYVTWFTCLKDVTFSEILYFIVWIHVNVYVYDPGCRDVRGLMG